MRNIRPSWLTTTVDDGPSRGTGPRARTGRLFASLLVRENGQPLGLLGIRAISSPDGATVTVAIVDNRTGTEIFRETFQQ